MKAKGMKFGTRKRSKVVAIFTLVMCLMPVASQARSFRINVQDARFTQPAIELLIKQYHHVHPDFSAEVVRLSNGEADATVNLSTGFSGIDVTVGRFFVLPVANSQNELLQIKKVVRGLNDKLQHQIYVERDVVETLEDEESEEKPLPGTVYSLTGSKAVTTQVLARHLQTSPSHIKGKKILGCEENLLSVVKSQPDAISYNVASLLYDSETRKPVSGVTVLAVDLDGNGRISDEEREAVGNLDTLTSYIDQLPTTSVAIGNINIKVNNSQLEQFIHWAVTEGQSHLARFGLLKATNSLTAQKVTFKN